MGRHFTRITRYHTNSPHYGIFNTRSTIKLEYEGNSFSEWSVPAACSVKNKRSPTTELRCSSPGFQTIKPIVINSDVEEERHLSVESSNTCFLWYYKVKALLLKVWPRTSITSTTRELRNAESQASFQTYRTITCALTRSWSHLNFLHNLTQIIVLWIYDPENADPKELLWSANEPSPNSIVLSKQLATLGQKPTIHSFMRKKIYFPSRNMRNGTWHISVPISADDVLKRIRGNQVVFQDCFVSDLLFLLSFPWLTIPEMPGFLPLSSPYGSPLMMDWNDCAPSSVVIVADMETFQTNDSFHTWSRVRVPPGILTKEERHNVSNVSITKDGIFFLINGNLYIKTWTKFARLGSKEELPEGEIIGTRTRKWCWTQYLMKGNKRSNLAVWTRTEFYLGYTSLKFVKITNTRELRQTLNLSTAISLTIHNADYTAHPMELALLLSYCFTCNVLKKFYLAIYNEDTHEWVQQDFALDAMIDSFIVPRFLYSALPELILWDKYRIYYYYHNFTTTGVIKTTTESGNLSRLSHDSVIHDVYLDYFGNIVVKMENNAMFHFKITVRDAVKLHMWTNSTSRSLMILNHSGHASLVYVLDNGTIYLQDYPLRLETESIALKEKEKEKCPFVAFHNNIFSAFYILDKRQNLSFWAKIVYPENTGLLILVESYGPKVLEKTHLIEYEIALGYCTKTVITTFFQKVDYEAVDDYFKLQQQNTATVLIQVRPSEYSKTCEIAPKVIQVAVGCDTTKYITVKRSNLRHRPPKNLRVKYKWKKYGCPLKLHYRETFHPEIQLYNENGFIEHVAVNFIVWEIHGRDDYSYNTSMKKSGCLNEAQTWKSMTTLNKHLPLESAWGPENYKHCFSYAIGKPGDLHQPYEIINKSNNNHLIWPMHHTGMYVFQVKILDPNYSFCNLTAVFAIEIYGVLPSPNGYLVASTLFLLMLLFFSILIFSYFHYMRIYKQLMYELIYKTERKQKNI
ncbi:PREDICTED: uncharacterized protein C1orf101 homolog isoform X2 [Miniopterus natalensis]|uniref:uncharacterized protein C1orf101 homolog isoform X2 n=1 Tax=Miniopterus natalensis TaxID=291302 RepID=UPI0007A71D1B|nr:PREDICTED: uncharacterized protein C1orf101 homolog isoform X2 [Miniopterus natalensis]